MSAKKYLLGVLVVPALFAGNAFAFHGGYTEGSDTVREKVEAYGVDDRGEIAKNSYGECWRTTSWTPELAVKECDPDLFPEPEPVAVAPKRAPIIPEKMTFSADALFDFDSAELKPHGKTELSEFISHLWDIQYDTIIVTGYTDRLGNPDYNKKLSIRRAESVKAYIVSHGVDASNILVEGKGEANSETGADCDDFKRGPDLIDCLTPDRRVEIKVTGMH